MPTLSLKRKENEEKQGNLRTINGMIECRLWKTYMDHTITVIWNANGECARVLFSLYSHRFDTLWNAWILMSRHIIYKYVMYVCVKSSKGLFFKWNYFLMKIVYLASNLFFRFIQYRFYFCILKLNPSFHIVFIKHFLYDHSCWISSFVCKVCYVFIMGNYYLVPWHPRSSEKLKIVINDETRTSLLLEDRRKITTQNWKNNEVKKERAYEGKRGRISKL